MAKNNIISVFLFGGEVGRIGLEDDGKRSSFQFNPSFLESAALRNIFPQTGILKRTKFVQMFSQFDNETFKGIPPQFADSLPDHFGSIVLKAWLDTQEEKNISVLEQLAYVGNRGMGALEYRPSVDLPKNASINLDDIIDVLKKVLDLKKTTAQKNLNSQALINIFKIGTSAGGARPKILISEHKQTGEVIPGDLAYSDEYDHYLVKLAIDDEVNYPREVVEFCYAKLLRALGIRMMGSKLIDDKHFATLRFDRQDGEKKHVLTATGMTGWDYREPANSSYENLFRLCSFLKIPHAQSEELYKRMVFNVVYRNLDDHLKNHSFIYDRERDAWQLSPVYDVTFSLNPLLNFNKHKRALSINGKRTGISKADLLAIADEFTIKNPQGVIDDVQSKKDELMALFEEHNLPEAVVSSIHKQIVTFE
jgi:serine/threonine-protein kinase HipA